MTEIDLSLHEALDLTPARIAAARRKDPRRKVSSADPVKEVA